MEVRNKHKIHPKTKARMNIPLCQMISMLIEQPTLLINVLKMEQAFQMGYWEGDKIFYISKRGRRNSLKITFNAFFKEALNLEDLLWHIFVDYIVLNMRKVQLFTIMTYMNKYDVLINYYQFQSSIDSLLSIYIPSIPCFFVDAII